MRQTEDSITHKIQMKFGFLTGRMTRPLIIAELVALVKENVKLINDIATLEEMLTFVKNENGRAEAQEGAHDDLLMGLAITYHIRDQQAYHGDKSYTVKISELPPDMQQDYRKASPDMKKYMEQLWGLRVG
jgi:phage terminase large subunit